MDTGAIEKEICLLSEKFESKLEQDILVYYGDVEIIPPSNNSEMNHEDRTFFEYLRDKHIKKHDGLTLMLQTSGGTISTAIELIDFLRVQYRDNITIIINGTARSSGTFLALCGDYLYIQDDPPAELSDFYPVSVPSNVRTREKGPKFIEQFSETIQEFIGDGLLKYRSADDVFSIVNRISPLYIFISSDGSHFDLSFKDLKSAIPDELKTIKEHPSAEAILEMDKELKEVLKDHGLQKICALKKHVHIK